MVVEGMDEDELLALAAAVERESEHPLAEAVVREAEARGAPALAAERFRSLPGRGASAQVANRRVLVGNATAMADAGVDLGALGARRDELAGSGRTQSSWRSTAAPRE